jgi:predicted ester cyclase
MLTTKLATLVGRDENRVVKPGAFTDVYANPANEFARMARAGCSDMHVTIEQAVVDGNVVVVRARWQGTHDGVFLGHPPTGQRLDFEGMVFWRVDADGRIVHRHALLDTATMERQLTAVAA